MNCYLILNYHIQGMYCNPTYPEDHFFNKYCNEPTSWFEFFLDDTGSKLKSHIDKKLDPSPAFLISLFVDKASSQISNIEGAFRQYAPKLWDLSIQTGSYVKWDHKILSSMPIIIRQKLLSHLVKSVVPEEIRASDISQRNLNNLPKDSLGSLFLYHHWIHYSFIQLQLPQKVEKKDFELPGFQPPTAALSVIEQELPHSIEFLQKIVDEKPLIELPTLSDRNCNGDSTVLNNNFAVIQAYYDLGELYFFNKSYSDAYTHFKEAEKLMTSKSESSLSFTKFKLSCYLDGLQFLTATADIRDTTSIISRLEMTKASNYQGCIEILLQDNFRRELSIVHRQNFVKEVSECCNDASMYKQAYLANVLLEVIMGNGVSHNFWDFLKTDKDLVLDFLISATINYLENDGVKRDTINNLRVFFLLIMTKRFMKNKSPAIMNRIGKQLNLEVKQWSSSKTEKAPILEYEPSKDADLASSYRELASTTNFSRIKDVLSQICQLQPNFHMRTFCVKLFKDIRDINTFLPLIECFSCPRPLSYALCYKIAVYYTNEHYQVAEKLLFEVKEYLKNAQYTAFRRGNNSLPLEKLETLIEAHLLNKSYCCVYNPTKPSQQFVDRLKMLTAGQHSNNVPHLALDTGAVSALVLNANINPNTLNPNFSYEFFALQLWNYTQNQDYDLMPVFQLLSSLHLPRPPVNKLTRPSFVAFCERIYSESYLELILGLLVHLFNTTLGDRAEPHQVIKYDLISKSWPTLPREVCHLYFNIFNIFILIPIAGIEVLLQLSTVLMLSLELLELLSSFCSRYVV